MRECKFNIYQRSMCLLTKKCYELKKDAHKKCLIEIKELFLHLIYNDILCICRIIDLVLDMNYSGLIIAVITFLVIGLFHPLVVKGEYYFGTRIWWLFAIAGVFFIIASLLVTNDILSPVLGVIGCSCLWSILEIFEQKERVEKGWFPMNPKRKGDYKRREQ